MPGHREIRIDLAEVSLTALSWGADDGPLVVCLHGFPDTAWTWRHLGPVLANRGWRVVAPFSRGYAPSSLAADASYHIGALMDDAVGLHAALGGDARAVLIGHDWGAVTANALGAHGDSPFRAVVSLSVPPLAVVTRRSHGQRLGGDLRLTARQLRKSWYILFNQLPNLPERAFARLVPYLWRTWSPTYQATDDLWHVTTALDTAARRSAALGYYRAFLRPAPPDRYRGWQMAWDAVPSVPTLYLHGAHDGCIDAELADRVRNVLPPGSAVVIHDVGHFPHLEQPDIVNRRIVEFLAS